MVYGRFIFCFTLGLTYPTQQNSSRDPNKIPFKALGKFSSYVYFGGHLMPMNIVPRIEEGSYTYSLRVGTHIMPTHRCKICLALKE
jgi:hypothetical protein